MNKNLYSSVLRCVARLLPIAAMLLVAAPRVSAYDFNLNGLCYDINDDGTSVTVTYETYPFVDEWDAVSSYASLSGNLSIPATARLGSKAYTVTAVGELAFYKCSNLNSVTIPNSVTSIGNSAFEDCSGLTLMTLGEKVEHIGEYAFGACGLTEVTIPASVKRIESGAFDCQSLNKVNVADLAKWCEIDFDDDSANPLSIAHHLYMDGIEVTSLFIPEGVKSLKSYAFYGCTGLTAVRVPASVKSIGDDVFRRCSGLAAIVVNSGNNVYDSRSGCNAIVESATNKMIVGCAGSTFPEGIAVIGEQAFYECEGITKVELPGSVVEVEDWAFANCINVTSVTFSEGLKRIGRYAFTGNAITSVSIPASVTEIGRNAFNCRQLATVELGSNQVNLEEEVFLYTAWLASFNATDNPVVYLGTIAYRCLTNAADVSIKVGTTSIAGGAFYYRNNMKTVSIPSTVTQIGPYAFDQCRGLSTVNIPSGVTAIQEGTFNKCYSLVGVTIPNTVTTIGMNAFSGCSNLLTASIPSSVTTIENGAFSGCSRITNVYLPASVKTLGYNVFGGCNSLEAITVNGSNPRYDSRDGCNAIIETATNTLVQGCKSTLIPATVTAIGENSFRKFSSLTQIDIPESVTSIGSVAFAETGLTSVSIPNSVTCIGSSAFSGCNALTEVSLGNAVDSIREGAFYYCESLNRVNIPASVRFIGWGAFNSCSGLNRIEAYPNPAKVELGDYVFAEVPKDGTLHVLPAHLEAYKKTAQWRDFSNIVADLHLNLKGDVNADSEVSIADVTLLVSLVGQQSENENSDVNGDGETGIADVTALVNLLIK